MFPAPPVERPFLLGMAERSRIERRKIPKEERIPWEQQ
jgi:hypothetical protein